MMRKRVVAFALSLVFLAAMAQAGQGLSFKFYGGAGYWPTGGDFKELFESTAARWEYVGYTGTFDLAWKPLAFEGGVQAVLGLTPRLGLALGAGYLMKTVNRDSLITPAPGNESEHVSAYKINAIPVTLDLVYAALTGPVKLNLSAGVGFYSVQFTYDLHSLYSEPGRIAQPNWVWDVRETFDSDRKGVLGFQVGLGTEFPLTDRIFLCLDAIYRVASFDDIVGFYEWNDVATWTGGSDSETFQLDQAKVWYSESLIWGNLWHYMDISESKPTGSDDARLFKFDLGGPVVRIGIRIGI